MGNLLVVFSLLWLTLHQVQGAMEYVPANPAEQCRRVAAVAEAGGGGGVRRMVEPFKLCLDCRCCAANNQNECSVMPCCFGIDCNIPAKPFGVCAFVPNACNCTSCH